MSAAPASPIATAGSPARRAGAGGMSFNSLAHIDLKTGRRTMLEYDAGDAPGEPVFVPRSAAAAEGDGFVLSVVYRGAEDRSELQVFEAQDLAAGPIARARVPHRVPFGFHGNWWPHERRHQSRSGAAPHGRAAGCRQGGLSHARARLCPRQRRACRASTSLTTPRELWFHYSLFGWGVGLLAHGVSVYGVSPGSREAAVQREMERLRRG